MRKSIVRMSALAIAFCSAASQAADPAFVTSVDLSRFRLIAVQHDGRFKTFDTLAREMIRHVTGTTVLERRIGETTVEQDAVFTYLDLLFTPASYNDTGLLFIKKQPVREQLLTAAGSAVSEEEAARIRKTGRVSMRFLTLPAVTAKLEDLNRDIMKTAKDVDLLMDAASLSEPQQLKRQLRIIPPPGSTDVNDRWHSIEELETAAPSGESVPGMRTGIPGLTDAKRVELSDAWAAVGMAWRAGDATKVTAALNTLAGQVAMIAPAVYPPQDKLSLEHWYYKTHKMTWVWWFYMLAVVFLLLGVVYQWRRARLTGIIAFGVAFTLHTIASGIRWYLAGRIPNSNMFEAVTAAAWFGAAMAIFYELGPALTRRNWAWLVSWILVIGGAIVFVASLLIKQVAFNDWQNWGPIPTASLILFSVGSMALISMVSARRFNPAGLPLLGACVAAMVALMCGRFMPIALSSDISNRMPVLNDLWLYIHTNMIIASYALIGIAFVTAGMYVVGRLLTRPTPGLWLSMLIPAVVVPLPALPDIIGKIAWLLRLPVRVESAITLQMILPAWMPFLIVLAAWAAASVVRLVWSKSGERAYQVWEGAAVPFGASVAPTGSMPLISPLAGADAIDGPRRSEGLAKVLDGATMLLMELSFITLWTGIIMGAVWADHSWGRPWGWDPKEVFALNTWIIFLILVHVRLKVQDKALWTAVLAVIGCSVMLFNWIVVNFFITGLHSYA